MPKILIIDDKEDNLIVASALLKNLIPGCTTITALSGIEGLDKAKSEQPDTILLDIKMPGMDGYEVCERLKQDEILKHIPVIMVSAIKVGKNALIKGLETGADAYLAKPIDEYVLAAQVKTALRIKKAEDLLRNQKKILENMVLERTDELMQTNSKLQHEIEEHRQTARKKDELQIQLVQSQKMESIGTLAGGIAHDFNNILFPIVGHTEMLLEDVSEDSSFRDSLNEIYTGALRASELVKQILTFSRQESGEMKLIKMQPIIREALKLIRSTIPTTIEIKQDIKTDCGVIKADPIQIHQIIMNLTTNAYHAMEETGGKLTVSLKEIEFAVSDSINPNMIPGVYICLTITDTGKGMDKELTQKIFDPFFTTKGKGKGTGMGLSVVHGIVASMKGGIQVYSEPGKGTRFQVYLPVVKSLAEERVTHSQSELQTGTEHILLVDDEEAILTMEKKMLERLGYHVSSHISSIEAIESFSENPDRFDLVITDMAMPNISGDKLAVELTKIRPDIPILLCTGFSEAISQKKAASLGIRAFLMKPIVKRDLSKKIREVLDKN